MTTLPAELRFQKVLDKGYVKFIDSMGTDESVIEAARMSTARGFERWDAGEVCKHCREPREHFTIVEKRLSGAPTCADFGVHQGQHEIADFVKTPGDAKLLERMFSGTFLTEPPHEGPFEQIVIAVDLQMPLFVARQWFRYRTFSPQEMSGRYIELPDLNYVPDVATIALQDSKNKQGGGVTADKTVAREFIERLEKVRELEHDTYEWAIAQGIAREQARFTIGVTQYTRFRWLGNLRNWLHLLHQRLDNHAQWQTREYAQACSRIVQGIAPRSYALFEEYTLGAVRFSRTEIALLRVLMQGTGVSASLNDMIAGDFPDKAKRTAFLKKLGFES